MTSYSLAKDDLTVLTIHKPDKNSLGGLSIRLLKAYIPSINRIYGFNRNTGKRFLYNDVKEFKNKLTKAFFQYVLRENINITYKRVRVDINIGLATYRFRRCDLDNLLKVIIDAMKGTFISDDKNIVMLRCVKYDNRIGDMIDIIIKDAEFNSYDDDYKIDYNIDYFSTKLEEDIDKLKAVYKDKSQVFIMEAEIPSFNELWRVRSYKGRVWLYINDEVKSKIKRLDEEMIAQRLLLNKSYCYSYLDYGVDIRVFMGKNDFDKRDIDNMLKVLIDRLEGKFIRNDRDICKLSIWKYFDPRLKKGKCDVYIRVFGYELS